MEGSYRLSGVQNSAYPGATDAPAILFGSADVMLLRHELELVEHAPLQIFPLKLRPSRISLLRYDPHIHHTETVQAETEPFLPKRWDHCVELSCQSRCFAWRGDNLKVWKCVWQLVYKK